MQSMKNAQTIKVTPIIYKGKIIYVFLLPIELIKKLSMRGEIKKRK